MHHVHVLSCGWTRSWSWIFFFQRNILVGSFLFFKIFISLFFSKLYFVFPLALYFESSSNSFSFLLYTLNPLPICHLYIHFFLYIKGTIVEKPNLNFFKEFFQALNVLQSIWGSRLELFWKILLIFGSQFQETRLEFTMRNPFNFWTIFNFVSFAFTFFLFLFLIVKKIPWVIWCGECCNVESHVVTSDACPS